MRRPWEDPAAAESAAPVQTCASQLVSQAHVVWLCTKNTARYVHPADLSHPYLILVLPPALFIREMPFLRVNLPRLTSAEAPTGDAQQLGIFSVRSQDAALAPTTHIHNLPRIQASCWRRRHTLPDKDIPSVENLVTGS